MIGAGGGDLAPFVPEAALGSLLMVGAAEVQELFDVRTAIASQRHAFRELGGGRAQLAPRLLLEGPGGSTAFCYAARVSDQEGAVAKFGSVVLDNDRRGLPAVNALVTVLDAVTGAPRAILEGTSITTLRTSAASAVAAEVLVPSDPLRLAVIGTGVQAEAHVRALAAVLHLEEVVIWGRSAVKAAALAERLVRELGIVAQASVTAEQAVVGAALVVCCTTATTPVIEAAWLSPRAVVISVGSFAPDHHEVGQDLLELASLVVVDHVETALEQAGPVMAAVEGGRLDAAELVALGELMVMQPQERALPEGVVFYNSVGIGIQDAAAAQAILEKAEALGAGVRLAW